MKRQYNFEWYETKMAKYGDPIIRHSIIDLSHPTGKTEIDAKKALSIFMAVNGNLKKNTIVRIKEMDENGQIGEDIVPSEGENAIVPMVTV